MGFVTVHVFAGWEGGEAVYQDLNLGAWEIIWCKETRRPEGGGVIYWRDGTGERRWQFVREKPFDLFMLVREALSGAACHM